MLLKGVGTPLSQAGSGAGKGKDMQVQIVEERLNGIVVVQSDLFEDERGFFSEIYRADQFDELGLGFDFVQDNHSGSVKGVLRGLHYQWEPPMGKLMRVAQGKAFLVAVDIRKNSPTLGEWFGLTSTAGEGIQVWAPAGFARGFCILSDWAEIQYKCTGTYNRACESGIIWNDPDIGIDWPIEEPLLSEKDSEAQTLKEWLEKAESDHFRYQVEE